MRRHRPTKPKLALLAALLTLISAALAPTPATAMDDKGGTGSGSECQATFLPFIGWVGMNEEGFCELDGGGSSGGGEGDGGSGDEAQGSVGDGGQAGAGGGAGEPDCDPEGQPTVGEIYCAHSTPQAKTDPPQPRRDGCYFGCLRKGGNPVTGREHNGFPDDRPGRGNPPLHYGQEKKAEKQKPPSKTDCKSPENGSMRSQHKINKWINYLIDTKAALPDPTSLRRQRRGLESNLDRATGDEAKNLAAQIASLGKQINEVEAKDAELSRDLERARAQLEKELNAYRDLCKKLYPDLQIGKDS
jgi:hypothetical protein